MWRTMFDQWERQLNEAGNKLMGTQQFGAAMGQASALPLQIQKQTGEFMAKYLAALNLPSRDDIAALGERLRLLEQAVTQLVPAAGAAAAPMPPRTRKPATKAVAP